MIHLDALIAVSSSLLPFPFAFLHAFFVVVFAAFENQLYNQSHGFAPPSYNAVISETLATTHPTVTLPAK